MADVRGVDLNEVERLLDFMAEARPRGIRIRARRRPHPPEEAVGHGASAPVPARLRARAHSRSRPGRGSLPQASTWLRLQPSVRAGRSEDLHVVKSPIVGTFYAAPSPGRRSVCHGRRASGARAGALHHRSDEADERDRIGRGGRSGADLRRERPARSNTASRCSASGRSGKK